MAVTVWLTRRTQFNGGRLGGAKIEDRTAAELIKKGDALPFDKELRRNLAAWNKAEAEAQADNGDGEPKRRGRPPKTAPEPTPEPAPKPAPEPEPAGKKAK
jgi:hypothetical protein